MCRAKLAPLGCWEAGRVAVAVDKAERWVWWLPKQTPWW